MPTLEQHLNFVLIEIIHKRGNTINHLKNYSIPYLNKGYVIIMVQLYRANTPSLIKIHSPKPAFKVSIVLTYKHIFRSYPI